MIKFLKKGDHCTLRCPKRLNITVLCSNGDVKCISYQPRGKLTIWEFGKINGIKNTFFNNCCGPEQKDMCIVFENYNNGHLLDVAPLHFADTL